MRKVLPFMGTALATLAITWATQAKAADTFADVPQDHWAYAAVTELQKDGILIGYPDGRFNGQRVLTRYEFAVALKRALDTVKGKPGPAGEKGADGQAGAKGDTGATGETGAAGPPGMTPEQVATLMRLTDEFKTDLANVGMSVKQINAKLDALTKDMAALKDQISKMIQFSGDFFVGIRGDRASAPYVDYSGATRGANFSPVTNLDTPHDFHLGVKANLAGGVKFVGDLVNSNYLTYLQPAGGGGVLGNITSSASTFGGGTANKNGGASQTAVYRAELQIPISQFGKDTTLTVGRFKNHVTHLTYMRPDNDAYFGLPWYDDGNYVQDGVMISSKFGSAKSSIWGATYNNLTTDTPGNLLNQPIVGLGPIAGGVGGVGATQTVGMHIAVPLFKFGELGVTLMDFSSAPPAGASFGNVVVYGANFDLKPMGRFNIGGEAAKSVTQLGFSTADANSNDDNNAYNLHLAYRTGKVGIHAGYQYIDPRFGAPGYWDKIGNWYNPTNVQGPFAKVSYTFSDKLMGTLGGEFLSGARQPPGPGRGFTMGSTVSQLKAGVKYKVNSMINFGVDYEGDFFDISGGGFAGSRGKPLEQYITLGAGLNLAGNTVLKLAYQILNTNDHGTAFGFNGAAPGQSNNASVWTTSVAVHF